MKSPFKYQSECSAVFFVALLGIGWFLWDWNLKAVAFCAAMAVIDVAISAFSQWRKWSKRKEQA